MKVRSSYQGLVRYPANQKQASRARILGAAAELFKRRGLAATGVDAVMAAAGLTPGGFYSHFRSKEALITEAVAAAGQKAHERWIRPLEPLRGAAWSRAFLASYLSEEHRDDIATGCSIPSLAADVARTSTPARRRFEARLRGLFELVSERANDERKLERDEALAAVALCVGGLLLSRVVVDRRLSAELLGACRRSAERLLAIEGAPLAVPLRKPPKKKKTKASR
jgi:TetR/AcrR family transcriptional repressor of nem operon